jgi:hypothetical protein
MLTPDADGAQGSRAAWGAASLADSTSSVPVWFPIARFTRVSSGEPARAIATGHEWRGSWRPGPGLPFREDLSRRCEPSRPSTRRTPSRRTSRCGLPKRRRSDHDDPRPDARRRVEQQAGDAASDQHRPASRERAGPAGKGGSEVPRTTPGRHDLRAPRDPCMGAGSPRSVSPVFAVRQHACSRTGMGAWLSISLGSTSTRQPTPSSHSQVRP